MNKSRVIKSQQEEINALKQEAGANMGIVTDGNLKNVSTYIFTK